MLARPDKAHESEGGLSKQATFTLAVSNRQSFKKGHNTMNHIAKHLCLLSLAACLTACEDEGVDVLDLDVPEGYALSAGSSTISMKCPGSCR